MTYSLNPTDPFAEDEGAVLVVPEDRPEFYIAGSPLISRGPDGSLKMHRCENDGTVLRYVGMKGSVNIVVLCNRGCSSWTDKRAAYETEGSVLEP